MVEIWHNPRCTKSRQALAFLEEQGIDAEVVRYLDTPPTKKRLKEVIELLGGEAIALVRTKEAVFKELGLTKTSSAKVLIDAMAEHPKLIERPVVITKKGARIGRPTEAIAEIL
ncbi:MAG: arsenate reductase (glutaredoxin) [Myxococcota bacterium]